MSRRHNGGLAGALFALCIVTGCGEDAETEVPSSEPDCETPPAIPPKLTFSCQALPEGSTEGCAAPGDWPWPNTKSPGATAKRYPVDCLVTYPFAPKTYPCQPAYCVCGGGGWTCPL